MENKKDWVDKKIWKKVYHYCPKCGEPKYNKIMGLCESCGYVYSRNIRNEKNYRSFDFRLIQGFNILNSGDIENEDENET